jgi:hypothetical protein
MRRAFSLSIPLFAAVIASSTMAASELPLLCEENLVTGHRRCGISRAQAREVMRFVRTIPGVSHQIITIDALDLPQVVITTGDIKAWPHHLFATGGWALDSGEESPLDQERLDHFGHEQA